MKDCTRYTLRIPQNLQKKIKFTADFNRRSQNREIEMAINLYVRDFERKFGPIEESRL